MPPEIATRCCQCGGPIEQPQKYRFLCAGCQATRDAESLRDHMRMAVHQRRERRRQMQLPDRYLDDPPRDRLWAPTAALVKVWHHYDDLMRAGRRWLWLLGPTGVGKTVAVAALTHAFAHHEYPDLRWFHVPRLLRELGDFDHQEELMADATARGMVVLDDLGAGHMKPGGMVEQLLEEILCTRADEGRHTVVTSNLTAKQIASLFSDRLIDRLRCSAGLYVVPGPSLRKPPE